MIVVFDASSFVSAVLKADSIPERAFLRATLPPEQLIVSEPIVQEYEEVLRRPKFRRVLPAERREAFLAGMHSAAQSVVPTEQIRACRDPDDDMYLEAALAGRADIVVSSDVRHLVAMDGWRGLRILRPSDYLAMI